MIRWAILTGEYPPQPGGVSDYTHLVATELAAAGDHVSVYAPHTHEPDPPQTQPLMNVHRLPGCFGPGTLSRLERSLRQQPRPDRILVQYVPHAFGWKGMNLPFAMWLSHRARRIAPVWVMFHEVLFPFSWRPVRHATLATVTRLMARRVAGTAERVFVSIPAWGELLHRICPKAKPAEWLPVPSVVATSASTEGIAEVRRGFPLDAEVVGHFGTFGGLIADMLAPAACEILRRRPLAQLLLIGRNSDLFRSRLAAAHPELAGRVKATGELPPSEVAAHLRACDILLQPYPDGISSRRTSAMAGLANGVPVVSNLGALSEPMWVATDGVGVRVAADPGTLGMVALTCNALNLSHADRKVWGNRALTLYETTFDIKHTITTLQTPR